MYGLDRWAAAGTLAASLSGCLFTGYDGAHIEGDDVRLEVPGQTGFRKAGDRGEVATVIGDTAAEVNGWVSELVEETAAVIEVLSDHRETRRDGKWRIYGPFDDDQGRNLAWVVRIAGDAEQTDYEVLIGHAGADESEAISVMSGGIKIDGDIRTGGFRLDFDAIEQHPEIKDAESAGLTYSGAIEVSFERDVSDETKTIEIQFEDFREERLLGDAWYSNEAYEYNRAGDGSGTFHLAVNGKFDDNAFGGDRVNRIVLDAAWLADESGAARGSILASPDGTSGLPDGDLHVVECFDGAGGLVHREVNAPYDQEDPDYNFGEVKDCSVAPGDL